MCFGDRKKLQSIIIRIAGPLVLTQAASSEALVADDVPYNLNFMVEEVSTSINTAAAGGNARLMAIG